jgi:hypothetical protein
VKAKKEEIEKALKVEIIGDLNMKKFKLVQHYL